MAKQVKAYRSEDGQIYSTLDQAIAADLIDFVNSVSGGESGLDSVTAHYMAKNSDTVIKILLAGVCEDDQ